MFLRVDLQGQWDRQCVCSKTNGCENGDGFNGREDGGHEEQRLIHMVELALARHAHAAR